MKDAEKLEILIVWLGKEARSADSRSRHAETKARRAELETAARVLYHVWNTVEALTQRDVLPYEHKEEQS